MGGYWARGGVLEEEFDAEEFGVMAELAMPAAEAYFDRVRELAVTLHGYSTARLPWWQRLLTALRRLIHA